MSEGAWARRRLTLGREAGERLFKRLEVSRTTIGRIAERDLKVATDLRAYLAGDPAPPLVSKAWAGRRANARAPRTAWQRLARILSRRTLNAQPETMRKGVGSKGPLLLRREGRTGRAVPVPTHRAEGQLAPNVPGPAGSPNGSQPSMEKKGRPVGRPAAALTVRLCGPGGRFAQTHGAELRRLARPQDGGFLQATGNGAAARPRFESPVRESRR
jgi:hypothetical protein